MEGKRRRSRGRRGSGAPTRRGPGGAQGRGRVRTRGGRGCGLGAGTAGLGAHRPSASDFVTSGALQSFDEVHAMERPLHESRRRELPSVRTVPEGSQSLWSSLQEMVPPSPSTSQEPTMCSAPPSPALYVECGGSGQSTPRSIRKVVSILLQPLRHQNEPFFTTFIDLHLEIFLRTVMFC